MDEVQHLVQGPVPALRVQAQPRQAQAVIADALGPQIALPDAEIAGFQRQAQPLLAVAQAELRLLALVDVDGGANHAQRPTLRIALRDAAEVQDPEIAAVAAPAAGLDPVRIGLAGDHGGDGGADLLAVVGVVGVAGTLDVEVVGADGEAQQVLERMVDADLPGGEIELPHALAARLKRQLEPALALGQAALGQLARGDVPADGQVGGGSTLLVQEHPVDPFLPALALRTRRDVVIVAGARGRGAQAGDVALDLVDLMGRRQVEQVGADHLVDRPLALPRERLVAVEDRAVRAPARDHLGLHVENLEGRDAEVRRGEAGKLRPVRGDGGQEGHEQARLGILPEREGAGAGPVGEREPAEPGLGRLDGALLGPGGGDPFGQ